MKQYLLPETGAFRKVNMHSHSTFSDGKNTPEEIKAAYKAKGYSAVAFTEHEHIIDVTHLTDDEFVAITAYEYDYNTCRTAPSSYVGHEAPPNFQFKECLHLNLYAKDPYNFKAVCHNPKFVHCGNSKLYRETAQYVGDGNFQQEFTVENFNEVIRTARENGFLVTYNHPNWSLNTYETYSRLEGLNGLEICNGNCTYGNDYAPIVYDQMLRSGKRIMCVAGDDNHSSAGFFRSWTMIKTDELSYEALIDGLEKGNCYASSGPEILDLYVEDGKVYVRCSEAKRIDYFTAGRRRAMRTAKKGEALLTEAVFEIDPNDVYFRIAVRDEDGEHASSRGYWLDELECFKTAEAAE